VEVLVQSQFGVDRLVLEQVFPPAVRCRAASCSILVCRQGLAQQAQVLSLTPLWEIKREQNSQIVGQVDKQNMFGEESGSLKCTESTSTAVFLVFAMLDAHTTVAGLATWGKKVGRKWEQLKRSDSSELLAVTPGRRRHWSPNKSPQPQQHVAPGTATRSRRISRVESLRNLFAGRDRKSVV
jgi:hypothetical protein